jgi:hypothetical protein
MELLRTIPWFSRVLVGLFLIAQFAGMVSSPRANAVPMMIAEPSNLGASHIDASTDHHHAHAHGEPRSHHDYGGNPADTCCGLHACFAGILPLVISIATETIIGEPLAVHPDDLAPGAPCGRLDRPPRPLH